MIKEMSIWGTTPEMGTHVSNGVIAKETPHNESICVASVSGILRVQLCVIGPMLSSGPIATDTQLKVHGGCTWRWYPVIGNLPSSRSINVGYWKCLRNERANLRVMPPHFTQWSVKNMSLIMPGFEGSVNFIFMLSKVRKSCGFSLQCPSTSLSKELKERDSAVLKDNTYIVTANPGDSTDAGTPTVDKKYHKVFKAKVIYDLVSRWSCHPLLGDCSFKKLKNSNLFPTFSNEQLKRLISLWYDE